MAEPKKILVIDDEADVRSVVQRILRDVGHEVMCADCGETALRMMEKDKVDLIILDLRMPGIGGMETLASIRRNNTSVPVILLSGYITVAALTDAARLGLNDFLTKPFRMDELLTKVNRLLKQ